MDERRDKPATQPPSSQKTSGAEASKKLKSVLVERYGDLKRRLTRRLGSLEWAEEALQDTYLRLEGVEAVGELRNPAGYLFRAAVNTALNQNRAEARRLNAGEVEVLLEIADSAPDALRIIEGRDDLLRLNQIMSELPKRQRAILLAARLEGLSRQDISNRLGISVSMVEKELRKAQEYCFVRFKGRS